MIYFSIRCDRADEERLGLKRMEYVVENNLLRDNIYYIVRPIMGIQDSLLSWKPVIFSGRGSAYYKNANGYYTQVVNAFISPNSEHGAEEIFNVRVLSPLANGGYGQGYDLVAFESVRPEMASLFRWIASYDMQNKEWHELG